MYGTGSNTSNDAYSVYQYSNVSGNPNIAISIGAYGSKGTAGGADASGTSYSFAFGPLNV